jgi:hypothetical protein
MGKRELVLLAAFVAIGVAVYHVTAPPPPPGSQGFSVAGLIRNMRRHMHGNRESASAQTQASLSIDASVRELRVSIMRGSAITITGESRDDIAADLTVTARGYDQSEARAAADASHVKISAAADAAVVSLDMPRNAFVPDVTLVIKVPKRLAVRFDSHFGRLVVADVASLDVGSSRGETRIARVGGRLSITQSVGDLEIVDAGTLKLNARNSHGMVRGIHGSVSVQAVGGELTMIDVAGPIEIDARNTELQLEKLASLKPPLRVQATNGRLRISDLHTEARLDVTNTEVDVALDAAAPLTIYSTGETITVTPPPAGYTLDATANEGRITVDDGDIKPSESDGEQHAQGAVRGGGPAITLRATRGDVVVRARGN